MDFQTSIARCFEKFATFSGRASRSEFWWFVLFANLISLPLLLFSPATRDLMRILHALLFALPTFAVGARRLHDIGKSGWWVLLMPTIVGLAPLIIWWATPSDERKNEYGEYDVDDD